MPYKDAEKKRARQREYCARPEVKAQRKASHAAWILANREAKHESEARRRIEKRAMCLVATTRTRARKRGLAFDLDQHVAELQARIDRGVCELTGVAFDWAPGRKFNSPSFDRINPREGYTYDNVRVVLNLANAAMGDWGEVVLAQVMSVWLLSGNAIVPHQAAEFVIACMETMQQQKRNAA